MPLSTYCNIDGALINAGCFDRGYETPRRQPCGVEGPGLSFVHGGVEIPVVCSGINDSFL